MGLHETFNSQTREIGYLGKDVQWIWFETYNVGFARSAFGFAWKLLLERLYLGNMQVWTLKLCEYTNDSVDLHLNLSCLLRFRWPKKIARKR